MTTNWQRFTHRFAQLKAEARIVCDEREFEAWLQTVTSSVAEEHRRLLDDEDQPA